MTGGGSRDVLIGGNGADALIGGAGDDLLVAGPTIFDDKPGMSSLVPLQGAGTGPGDYGTRFNTLINGTILTPTVKLGPTTFADDLAKDTLTGGADADAFFASARDVLKDRVSGEELFLR